MGTMDFLYKGFLQGRSFKARPFFGAAERWMKFKETQDDGRNKNWTMQRLLHGTLRLRYSPTGEQIQNGRTADAIPRDPITP